MLENFEKMSTMPQMTNLGNMPAGSEKHVPKTTTKTEVNKYVKYVWNNTKTLLKYN